MYSLERLAGSDLFEIKLVRKSFRRRILGPAVRSPLCEVSPPRAGLDLIEVDWKSLRERKLVAVEGSGDGLRVSIVRVNLGGGASL